MAFSFYNLLSPFKKNTNISQITQQRIGVAVIGSTSIQVLISDSNTSNNSFIEVFAKEFPFLSKHPPSNTAKLSLSKEKQLISVLKEIKSYFEYYKADLQKFISAKPSKDNLKFKNIIEKLNQETQLNIETLSDKQEAFSIAKAVERFHNKTKNNIIIKLDSNKLELIATKNFKVKALSSFNIGNFKAFDCYNKDLSLLQQLILESIESHGKKFKHYSQNNDQTKTLFATGQNIQMINRLANRLIRGKINKKTLTRDQLAIVVEHLSELTPKQLQSDLELSPSQAELMAPAAHVIQEFMFYLGFKSVYVPKISTAHGIVAINHTQNV